MIEWILGGLAIVFAVYVWKRLKRDWETNERNLENMAWFKKFYSQHGRPPSPFEQAVRSAAEIDAWHAATIAKAAARKALMQKFIVLAVALLGGGILYLEWPTLTCVPMAATWPMLTLGGAPLDVPNDQVRDTVLNREAGFAPGSEIPVTAPDGWMGYVKAERAGDAFQDGYRFDPVRIREEEIGKSACYPLVQPSALKYSSSSSAPGGRGGHRLPLIEIRPEPGVK